MPSIACCNTFQEERAQLVYASRVGLIADWGADDPPEFDLAGQSVVNLGGGPASLLLKTRNAARRLVIEPEHYPSWVYLRYAECGVDCWTEPGEDWELELPFDEGWVFDVLQHVEDPEQFVFTLLRNVKLIRLFEWIDEGDILGPHDFYRWLGGRGLIEDVTENGVSGQAFYGVFASR